MTDPLKLFQAIEANDLAAVTSILEADPILAAARNPAGLSAVMYAVYRGQSPIVAALTNVHPGLDIFEAAATGNVARVSELLHDHPDMIRAWSPDGATALHFACFFRQPEVADILIRAGADVHVPAKGFGTVTPLHSAVAGRNPDAVEALLHAGAKPDVRQEGGYSPLHSAAHNGDARSTRLLLDHGADVSLKTDDGKTAADLATLRGHADIVDMLARHREAGGAV
jgi:ankyrin repeat protein